MSNLTDLWLDRNELIGLPSTICNLAPLITNNPVDEGEEPIQDCFIDVSGNYLCEKYHYDCIDIWEDQANQDLQDQTNCCEDTNETDSNYLYCSECISIISVTPSELTASENTQIAFSITCAEEFNLTINLLDENDINVGVLYDTATNNNGIALIEQNHYQELEVSLLGLIAGNYTVSIELKDYTIPGIDYSITIIEED